MGRVVLSVVVTYMLATSCVGDGDLDAICPDTCYTGPRSTENRGECRSGTPVCDDDGNVTSCDGEVKPHNEICDAKDNDCDGEIDENLLIPPYESDNRCKQCGVCYATNEVCDSYTGQWYCDYRNGTPPETDESCNGVDDDCDCFVDEDYNTTGEIIFCYDGPPNTANKGECRIGIESCVDGVAVCDGSVTPTVETCDGTDQDCNGFVDDTSIYYSGIDIVFAIDVSGSMVPYIDAITEVVCDYASSTTSASMPTRMALVAIADPDRSFSLKQNLTDSATLCVALTDLGTVGSQEPTLSAAEAVVDPTNPLMLDWGPDNKRMFIGFGDEMAKAICPDGNGVCSTFDESVTNTLAYCSASETSIYWFVATNPVGYQEQAGGCGGNVFWLSPFPDYMLTDLNSILQEVCTEGP